ncbi:MAG: YciI family protein [Ardenticatenaceae bacterium]|nr:hypothetical protein [Anaerolineales bacterium]MCB8979147.1 YciI family protein [Ardenticatenaceae bacterium]
MNYLFLAYHDKPLGEALISASLASNEALRESGYLVTQVDLSEVTAVSVTRKNGSLLLTDGSVADPQQLAALFIIEARDLNEAIQLAARMPQAQSGVVEIRPLWVLDRSLTRNAPSD